MSAPAPARAGEGAVDSARVSTPARPARPRRPRRWHRIAVPFLVLGLVYLVTGAAHLVEEPDLGDPGTLSPTGSGPDGSSRLAGMLTGNGVTIRRVTSSAEALRMLTAGDARPNPIVFVPTPDLLNPGFFDDVVENVDAYRLVLVRPGGRTAAYAGFAAGPQRWAARTVSPGCSTGFASAAGPATVLRSRYQAAADLRTDCYGGGLVGWGSGDSEVVAVGATDPFRNGRIGEAGNAGLATALLGRDRDVIWVDVHRTEPRPAVPPPNLSLPRYHQPDRDQGGTDPMWHAFPPALWASLALLSTVAVLIALVQGRRLGPPVAEPLPVVVPATETITGRGRLYQRIRAREASLDILRAAALRRMTPAFDPYGARPPAGGAAGDELVRHIAARTGVPAAEVQAILHGPAPQSDDEFQAAVAQLDALVNAVLRVGSRPADTTGPVNPGGEP
jgi:hypothetical protein